jgi:hypothetical protein
MAETKHLVILANSIRARKRCVAGKQLTPTQNNSYDVGPWIRLTDPRSQDGAVPDQSMLCPNHGFARVLEVVKVQFRSHCGKADHPEDWWYDPDKSWEFVERGDLTALPKLADIPETL